jgi:CheY-like chemotaxis protein
MKRLLVIEDGHEYEEFAKLFLAEAFDIVGARSAEEALASIGERPPDAILLDLRFDRTPKEALIGSIEETAQRLFAGNTDRALRYLREQQGALVLSEIREAGCDAPAVFVHDFPKRRLANLRKMYGAVEAVASFDAAAILDALGAAK